MSGIKRNLEIKAQQMLDMFPVVAILGARQVGKTTLAKGWSMIGNTSILRVQMTLS